MLWRYFRGISCIVPKISKLISAVCLLGSKKRKAETKQSLELTESTMVWWFVPEDRDARQSRSSNLSPCW